MESETNLSGIGMSGSGQLRVRSVVREVVAEVAPAELVLVDGLAQFDDATAVRRLGGSGGRREPLGFGLGELAALVTPVVWLVLDQTARKLAESAVDSSLSGTRSWLRRMRRRTEEPLAIPPLTTEQLAEVRTRVVETASRRGLSAEEAEAVADAVVARLAIAATESPPARREGPAGEDSSGES
ncbi:hypothetical protein ACFVU3_37505 [Streptomyces sp. NPDC058052]|uniref:hypothetical protein n=1 Tax=Streptomyces sp. NPDC058052 TaxID=3346316 RepID=UPI0036E84034